MRVPLRSNLLALCLAALGGVAQAQSPLSQAQLPTTDGGIALGNLTAQIEGEQRLARQSTFSVPRQAAIAELLEMRGQFTGTIGDYEQAAEIAERLVVEAPADGRSYLARARSRAVFHRFADALADLERAEGLGVSGRKVSSARAAVLQATGRYAEAATLRSASARRDLRSLGAQATLAADRGDVASAERLFAEAQHRYRDISPFPVAWLYFQQGLMWLRDGRTERARDLFAAAHERLPQYAPARGHLAEAEAALGHHDLAIALLVPLAGTSDDPDYAAQLARILLESGRPAEALPWRARAAQRYDELMRLHPEAFADHATEFWLAAGADPVKALQCAELNAAIRNTPRAQELVLLATRGQR